MDTKTYLLWAPLLFLTILMGCKSGGTDGLGSDVPLDIEPNSPCTDGVADDQYSCRNVDLMAYLPLDSLKGDRANDIWGWTDPGTGKEYAIVGLSDGVTFVDISNPARPVVIGKLVETKAANTMASTGSHVSGGRLQHEEEKSEWRDFKVYNDHLFVVSDNQPDSIHHGMQIFDLAGLRNMTAPAGEYTEDVLYSEFHDAHNIAINEETGYAYVVGSRSHGEGLHIIDIRNPLEPEFAGYYADSTTGLHSRGYVHDTQCVIYRGPDDDYRGDEVCFNSAETHLAIVNVTQKSSAFPIATESYDGNRYAHQGWLTEDHQYFLLDDELDEQQTGSNTKTYIWDVRDLDDPNVIGVYEAANRAIDHNQYIKGNYTYQANYTSGLRILSLDGIASGTLEEVAYFDTHPENNQPEFDGAWSVYPFFESGIIIVSDISRGLFVLRADVD